jgi:hypothetical protein
LVNPCALPSIGQTWVLASNDAVFEMGDLIRALKRLPMESSNYLCQYFFGNSGINEYFIFNFLIR